MNNKTFGVVVGVIIALALAMFAGLYMLGLSGQQSQVTTDFNDGYELNEFYADDGAGAMGLDGDEYYDGTFEGAEEAFYFDEIGTATGTSPIITDELINIEADKAAYEELLKIQNSN